ncbi:hypothetical protein LTS14_002148 [Recurvomyces mirabilis]|uniref:uncharacterized protein n=1 Tax=Recurvomyces mirabilis TaxID=574656 RepID=UPI002DDE3BD2|nr:hypothetical protein LTS14_002148 [Recurvomyces mirabilis]
MATTQQETHLKPNRTRSAGVKRQRAVEVQRPRKTLRLDDSPEELAVSKAGERTDCYISGCDDRGETSLQVSPKTSPPRQTTAQCHRVPQSNCAKGRRNLQRPPAEEDHLAPKTSTRSYEDEQHPIAYWALSNQWPRSYINNSKDMEDILARKRSLSSRSRKNSDADSAPTGSVKPSEQQTAEYRRPEYKELLRTRNVFMEKSAVGVGDPGKTLCGKLLIDEQIAPPGTLFDDDIFEDTCKMVEDRNEAKVIQDIARLVVPSAETMAIRGTTIQKGLVESVNEGWNNCIPITKTRPQPDYAVGFRRRAFTQDQLDRMKPIVGDFDDQSYFMASWYMCFPFLTCEVKCGAAALDVADRQNAHSAAIAARAVVELFRVVKREKELHREILAFSISHDHSTVRIYGHYAETDAAETKYYRHTIHKYDFTALDGKEKWTAYRFTKNVYDHWMPVHFKRICSAIDQIPAGISFSESQSELHFSEPTGLSQDMSVYSVARSSEGSVSAQVEHATTSSIGQGTTATPGTSVDGGAVFKKPRRGKGTRG